MTVPTTPATSLRRAAAGATWSLAGTLVARLSTLGTALVAAALIGPTSFGTFVLVQSTVAMLSLGGLGLGLAATKLVSEDLVTDRPAAGRHIGAILAWGVAIGVTVGTAILVGADLLAEQVLDRPSLSSLLRAAAPLLLVSPAIDSATGALTGAHRFRAVSGITALRGVADAAGIITGAAGGGALGALVGLVIAEAGVAGITIVTLVRTMAAEGSPLQFGRARGSIRQVAQFSLPAVAGSILLQVALWASQLLLARRAGGLDLVGVFSVANKWYLAAVFVPTAAGAVLLPMLGSLNSTHDDAAFRRMLRVFVTANFVLTVPAALALLAAAPLLFRTQGTDFSSGVTTLRILALAVVPTALNNVLSQAAIAKRRVGVWVFSDVVLAIVLLGTASYLIPRRGAEGLAIAFVVAYTATCAALLPAFVTQPRRRFLGVRVRKTRSFAYASPAASRASRVRPALSSRLRPAFAAAAPHHEHPLLEQRGAAWPGVAAAACFAAVAFVAKLRGNARIDDVPALVLGPTVFVATQASLGAARPAMRTLLSPRNFAWLLFAIQLVVIPALVVLYGFELGQLSKVPSDRAITIAIGLQCLAYVAYAMGLSVADRHTRPARPPAAFLAIPSRALGATFVALGLFGTFVRFRSIGALVEYFSLRGGDLTRPAAGDTSMLELAGTIMRPFGAFGFLILLWLAALEPPNATKTVRVTVYALGAFASVASYDYNRASFLMPFVAAVATFSYCVRRISARTLVVTGLAILVVAFALGNVRRIELGTQGGRISREDALLTGPAPTPQQNLQVYGAAPQFTAPVIERIDDGSPLRLGASLIGSAMSPIPVVGEPFRSSSGTGEYNELIYGTNEYSDQIVPFVAELYWNFGAPGVAIAYFGLGLGIAALERALRRATTPIEVFVVLYASLWVAFLVVGQVLSLAQVAFYFGWPVVALAFVRSLTRDPARLTVRASRASRGNNVLGPPMQRSVIP